MVEVNATGMARETRDGTPGRVLDASKLTSLSHTCLELTRPVSWLVHFRASCLILASITLALTVPAQSLKA